MKFYIIGISDETVPRFSSEAEAVIAAHRVFSGGTRHRQIVAGALPAGAGWIEITIPLERTFERYRAHGEVVVFASGDPLFYGFAGTLMREFPDAETVVFPAFHSLQMLAHRALLPYHDLHAVSLTGRPWAGFDESLIAGRPMIGVLTDTREHTPAKIARRMLDYGYDNYAVRVGERLGNREQERVVRLSVEETARQEFRAPNVLILQKLCERERPLGIPDDELHHLPGRPGMITKMPIRLLALSLLDLRGRHVFWDVGSCTGSVSVEARLQFPHLEVVAFEKRPEGAQLLERNARRWGTPGIRMVAGDFRQVDLEEIPHPDAVFIGGYGGDQEGVIDRILTVIRPGAAIVFNSVSAPSRAEFERIVSQKGLSLQRVVRLSVDEHNPVEVMRVNVPNE
jgi:precorrin-6Y C5,15-methyltransferase (decarboxylating)